MKTKNIRNKGIIILLIISILLLGGCVSKDQSIEETDQNTDNIDQDTIEDTNDLQINIEEKFIPESFDKYYHTQPSEYLLKMNNLSSSMKNVIIDLQEGNISDAKESFNTFSQNYKDSLDMVPEWDIYYDTSEIDKLGDAINSENTTYALTMIDYVKDACTDCHRD